MEIRKNNPTGGYAVSTSLITPSPSLSIEAHNNMHLGIRFSSNDQQRNIDSGIKKHLFPFEQRQY